MVKRALSRQERRQMALRSGKLGWGIVCVALSLGGSGPGLAQTPGAQTPGAQTPGAQTQKTQTAGQAAEPSPFAPGDLKRPIFDTATPTYNVANAQLKTDNTVVAEVGGRSITLGTVADVIKTLPAAEQDLSYPLLFAQVRAQLIGQQALVIQAHSTGVDEDPTVVRKLAETSASVLADAYLRHVLISQITEQDLLDRYKNEIAGKPGPEEVHLHLIMLPTRDAAQAVITQLAGGADFAALAKQLSKDATAAAGGDLGWVQRRGVNPEIGATAFSLPVGQVTPYPVESIGSWFVLKVDERRQGAAPSFAASRVALTEELLRERVPAARQQALKGLAVRIYDISGRENTGGEEGTVGGD
jgi:peptidyl-prolyl cis-trans isomerase C